MMVLLGGSKSALSTEVGGYDVDSAHLSLALTSVIGHFRGKKIEINMDIFKLVKIISNLKYVKINVNA